MPAAPTAAELLANAIVTDALELAWQDSLPHDPAARHEEGGWIYMDVITGAITVIRAPSGAKTAIDLNSPAVVSGSVVVAKFHTHPNPTSEGWDPRPSAMDLYLDSRDGVPDLIRSDQGVFVSGPDSRRGGLGGPPGYPQ